MVELSGRRRKSDVGERSKSVIASHHPNTQREAPLSSLVCCFSRLSALPLSPSSPRHPFPIGILVEWFMYVVFLNLLFFQQLKPNRNQRVGLLSMLFNRLMIRPSSSVPAECSCVSMDLNISVIIPALLDIQVVPSSFPVFKTNTVCPEE